MIKGPYEHIYWEQRQSNNTFPGYVLENPFELFENAGNFELNPPNGEVRITARKKLNGEQLVCVWAADGIEKDVMVTLDDGGTQILTASPDGNLYRGFSNNLQTVNYPNILCPCLNVVRNTWQEATDGN